MRILVHRTIWTVLALSMSALAARAESPAPRFGYVNLQKALLMSPAAKERLEREFNKKKDALHGREVALHARDVDFKKRATALSDEARAKTLQDLQTEAMQLQKEMAEAQTALEKMQQELTQPILDRMHTALAKIAQRDGYAMIFDQREQNVVYADSALDLTPKLLAELTP